MIRNARERLEALKKILLDGELSTQEELAEKLERQKFETTQSTVSRDLKKLGAIKVVDLEGKTVYQLSEEVRPDMSGALPNLVQSVVTNGSIIVIRTAVGSASLVARHLDRFEPGEILGTIAGDDTIFVAPCSTEMREIKATMRAIEDAFRST